MVSLGDYDQSLNKLGQLLIVVKFGNSKANDEASKLRSILKPILTTESNGVCYYRELSQQFYQNFGDLQLHRSPFGVLMYCKCSSSEELKLVAGEFEKIKSSYGDGPLFRQVINVSEANCAFDTLLECQFTEETVLITKDFERTVTFAVKNFVADIFALAKKSLADKKAIPIDDMASIEKFLHGYQTEEKMDTKKHRKLLTGKWYKHLGDLSFACGALPESEQYFSRAVEFLKSANDPWLAAAKESLVAVSLLNLLKITKFPYFGAISNSLVTAKQWTQWLSLFEDATTAYLSLRQCHQIYMESLLRFVHLQLLANQKCNAARSLSTFASFEMLTIGALPKSVLDADQAFRHLKAAKVFESFGWHRKAAFYYRMAAMRCVTDSSQASEWVNCHHFLMKAVRGYGLASFSNTNSPTNITAGFVQLQSRLLMDLYTSSQAFSNYPLALRHACQALDIGGQTLFSYQLSQIFTDMRKLSTFTSTLESPIVIDPELVLLPLGSSPYPRLLAASFHHETYSRSTSIIRPSNIFQASSQKPSFIYSPFAHPEKSHSQQPVCVCLEEEVKINLELENPFVLPLKIDSLRLITSDKADTTECFAIVDEILFPGKPKCLALSCRCHKAGNLLIIGCSVTICGVTRKILFSDALAANNKFSQLKTCFDVEVIAVQLPFLAVQSAENDYLRIDSFLGEVSENNVPLTNFNPKIHPAIVDLTLKGVPLSMDKALSVSFISDSLLNVKVDGTILPCRYSAVFDVTAKFVYSSLTAADVEVERQDKGDGLQTRNSRYFRSFTFTFRISVMAAIHGSVVGIERRNRQELVLDVRFEHTVSHLHSDKPILVSQCNARNDDVDSKCILNPKEKRHIHCSLNNDIISSLISNPDSINGDCIDLAPVLKFQWNILSSENHDEILRSGYCSAIVCGSELISQMRVPPFNATVSWWKCDVGKAGRAKYEYGNPVVVKLADPVAFFISITATDELSNARIRLNLEYLPVLPAANRVQHAAVFHVSNSNSAPFLISGLSCSSAKSLVKNEILDHTFCLVPCATGRHRVSCDIVTSEGAWPVCPVIYLNCVD